MLTLPSMISLISLIIATSSSFTSRGVPVPISDDGYQFVFYLERSAHSHPWWRPPVHLLSREECPFPSMMTATSSSFTSRGVLIHIRDDGHQFIGYHERSARSLWHATSSSFTSRGVLIHIRDDGHQFIGYHERSARSLWHATSSSVTSRVVPVPIRDDGHQFSCYHERSARSLWHATSSSVTSRVVPISSNSPHASNCLWLLPVEISINVGSHVPEFGESTVARVMVESTPGAGEFRWESMSGDLLYIYHVCVGQELSQKLVGDVTRHIDGEVCEWVEDPNMCVIGKRSRDMLSSRCCPQDFNSVALCTMIALW